MYIRKLSVYAVLLHFVDLQGCFAPSPAATLAVAGALYMSTIEIVTLDCHNFLMHLNLSLVYFTVGILFNLQYL